MVYNYGKMDVVLPILTQTIAMEEKKFLKVVFFFNNLYQKVWNNMHKCTQEQNEENTKHKNRKTSWLIMMKATWGTHILQHACEHRLVSPNHEISG